MHESLIDRCEAALRREVLDGLLEPGQRLPPERDLAQRFGVNRVTVRSALARRKSAGLLEARQGRGTTVRDSRRTGGLDLLPDLARQARERGELPAMAEELFLIRLHLARALLERISERRPEPAPFHQALARFSLTDTQDLEALARADGEVLAALVELSGSPVLQLCLNPVRSLLAEQPDLRRAMYRAPATNAAGWAALGVWLEDPVPDGIEFIVSLIRERDAATVEALR